MDIFPVTGFVQGVLPAVVLSVLATSATVPEFRFLWRLRLARTVACDVWLVFGKGLGIPLVAVRGAVGTALKPRARVFDHRDAYKPDIQLRRRLAGNIHRCAAGVGPLAAVAMPLPVSFYRPPETAQVMLAGVYDGADYGGFIASIQLNILGAPSATMACLDGYPMVQQGWEGEALFATAIASFFGAIEGIVVPESANNAVAQTTFFPTLTLGIPGRLPWRRCLGP